MCWRKWELLGLDATGMQSKNNNKDDMDRLKAWMLGVGWEGVGWQGLVQLGQGRLRKMWDEVRDYLRVKVILSDLVQIKTECKKAIRWPYLTQLSIENRQNTGNDDITVSSLLNRFFLTCLPIGLWIPNWRRNHIILQKEPTNESQTYEVCTKDSKLNRVQTWGPLLCCSYRCTFLVHTVFQRHLQRVWQSRCGTCWV